MNAKNAGRESREQKKSIFPQPLPLVPSLSHYQPRLSAAEETLRTEEHSFRNLFSHAVRT